MFAPPLPEAVARLCHRLIEDQRQRWRRQAPWRVEQYLESQPELRGHGEAKLRLLYSEVLLREQAGETPGLEEYVARFPELSLELELQFAAHRMFDAFNAQAESRDNHQDATIQGICPSCRVPLAPGETVCPVCKTLARHPSVQAPSGPRLPSVPGYELLEELGRGGMGVVYKARDHALGRIVALKMLPPSLLDNPELSDRFQREAQSAARLHHANVVQIFDVGAAPAPFISMEYVEGGTLEDVLRQGPMLPHKAAEIVKTLAQAMQEAHNKGIIHRDLKPANVLLSGEWRGTSGEQEKSSSLAARPSPLATPKITDFGLAKRIDEEKGKTREGEILGSPPYMAPEQARGKIGAIGPLTDVYALGAILYQCLTARPPFLAATSTETLLEVLAAEPVPPTRLALDCPRDLEAVCLRCLEKDPVRRYSSAQALADELDRFLRGVPTIVRPGGFFERAAKWVRRRPLVAGLSAAVVCALLAGTGVSVAFAVQANQEAETAQRNEEKAKLSEQDAKRAKGLEEGARKDAEEKKTEALKAREKAEKETKEKAEALQRERATNEKLERFTYMMYVGLARREWFDNNVQLARRDLDLCPKHLRNWEWHYLNRLCNAGEPGPVESLTFSGYRLVAFSRRGDIATTDFAGRVVVWRELKLNKNPLWWSKEYLFKPGLPAVGEADVKCLALSEDGHYVAAVNQPWSRGLGSMRRQFKIWEVQSTKDVTPRWLENLDVHSLAFSPDGNRLTLGLDRSAMVLDLARGEPVVTFTQHAGAVEAIAFSGDGKRVASGSSDGSVRVWDAVTGKEEYVFEGQRRINCVAFSPDHRLLAAAGDSGHVKIWEVWPDQQRYLVRRVQLANLFAQGASGPLLGLPMLGLVPREPRQESYLAQQHDGMVRALAFSPDGASLASASNDRTVKLFDLAKGVTHVYRGHTDIVLSLAFQPGGKLLASGGQDKLRFWDPHRDQQVRTLGQIGDNFEFTFSHYFKLALSPNGKLVASNGDFKNVRVWETETGKEVQIFRGDARAIAFSADSKFIASAGATLGRDEIVVWDARTGKVSQRLSGHGPRVNCLAYSLDGRWLASGAEKEQALWFGKPEERPPEKPGTVVIWNAATGQQRFVLHGYRGTIQSLSFSKDGNLLASACDGSVVKLHDTRTGKQVLSQAGSCVSLDPAGSLLAVGSGSQFDGGQVTVFSTSTGQELFKLTGHSNKVAGVAFDRTGKRLASASHDGTVRVWDLETRQEIISLSGAGKMESVAFTADGHFLAAAGAYDTRLGQVWLWDARPVPERKEGQNP